MTDNSPATADHDDRRADRLVTLYISVIVVFALGTGALVASIEFTHGVHDVNWTLFVIITASLLITETQSRTWINVAGNGVVTPSWTFAFALMLVGTPFGATVAIALATLSAELIDHKPAKKVLFNLAQITLSISTGALVLFAFGVHGSVLARESTPLLTGIAVILSGFAVFTVNGIVLCKLLAILDGTSLLEMLRNGFAVSMSADGAMIAIAPILVITAQNTLLMLPLIGVATFFVYQTARQAIEQSHQADHDPLTQLLNRRAFSVQIDKFTQDADASASSGGVFVLDLDKFKEINDRLGHGTGDHVLQAFAQRLESSLPSNTTIARLGGDEFSILVVDRSTAEITEIAQSLHEEISQPLIVDGFPISAGSSIGVSFYPQHGQAPSELMHAADVAMYRAKQLRSGVEFYEILGAPQQKGRVGLLGDLAEAIEQNQFILTYQPQIDISSGRTTCVEALLRWNHPTLGMIAPGEFVALAEQTDLIGPLTELVIEQALTDAARLPDDVSVAINISARNLQDRHFGASVLEAISRHQFDPRRVELEITESAMSSDPEQSVTAIEHIRAAGIRMAIDDFGTGYSSFDTLRTISVDNIKIDRSFVTGATSSPRDLEILKALIDLGHGLGLTVVAEGVETAAVLEFLADAGCDTAQGYLIARPALIEDVVVHNMSLGDQARRIRA